MRKLLAILMTVVMGASAVPAFAFEFIPNEQAAEDTAQPGSGADGANGETDFGNSMPDMETIPATQAPALPEETIAPASEAPALPEQDTEPEQTAEPEQEAEPEQVSAQSVTETRYAKVVTENGTLNMRAEASADAKIIKRLSKGTVVTVVDTIDGWLQIDCDGTVGYVMSRFMEAYEALPYTPITKADEGEAVVRFKEALQRLGYLKAEDVNKYFDKSMENALTKVQLMNGLALDSTAVSAEMQALVDWNRIVKGKSGYLDTATSPETGLSISIFCWDSAGMIYADDEAVKVEITYAVQASGGQPPYDITVSKSLTGTGAAYGDEVSSPFSQIWRTDTDRLYIYATVADASGNTAEACAPFRYNMPDISTD